MSNIKNLTTLDVLSNGDLLPIWSASNGDTRKASVYALAVYLQEALTAGGGMVTQYAKPNVSGFSISVTPPVAGATMWVLSTPLAPYAATTLVLPPVAESVMGQEILMTTSQVVTALTINGNGATVTGAPTTLAANAFFRLRFDSVLASWIRIS